MDGCTEIVGLLIISGGIGMTLKRKIVEFIWAAFYAYGFYGLTVLIFINAADRSMIAAMALNFALIIFFLIFDKLEDYFVIRLKAKEQNTFTKIVIFFFSGVSFRSALYLFYVYILICLAIEAVEPDFFSEETSLYLQTVEYGILLLIAADTFLNQFLKDVEEVE